MFKEVQSLDADTTVALGKKDKATGKPYPKQAEGYYLGSRVVENKRGESVLHFLSTDKGNLGVWGTTDLNRKLKAAPLGTMVRITSTGTKPTPNGDMYTYKVEFDDSNTIEVADLSSGNETAGNEVVSDESEDDQGEQPDGYDAEAEAAAAELLAAEKAAKVQAILARAKTKKA